MKLEIPDNIVIKSNGPVSIFFPPAKVKGGRKPIEITYSHESGSIFNPNTETLVEIRVKDTSGQVMTGGFIIKIEGEVIKPHIDSLIPSSGLIGSDVNINGSNFGALQDSSFVTFSGTIATIVSWSDTLIVATVPNVASGPVIVTVNGVQSNSASFEVTDVEPVEISIINDAILPSGNVGIQFSIQFEAVGGVGPYEFAVSPALIPSGSTFSSSGLYTGIPTNTGTFIFTVEVADSEGNTGSKEFTQVIEDALPVPLQFLTPSVPNGSVGVPYSAILQGSGGTLPYTFSIFSGSLPVGLSLVGDIIQGTPTTAGTSNFTIRLRDNNGIEVFRAFQIQVTSIPLSIITISDLKGIQNQPFSLLFGATGGVSPYIFTRVSGLFPVGLSLSNNVLSGTPTILGVSNFIIRCSDVNGNFVDKAFTFTVVEAAQSHAYFNFLQSSPYHFASYSLRDQSQIEQLRTHPESPSRINYIWPNDTYPHAIDLAKILITEQQGADLHTQVIFNMGPHHPLSVLVVWDVMNGAAWDYTNAGIWTQKGMLQFCSPGDQIWLSNHYVYNKAKQNVQNLPPGGPYVLLSMPHSSNTSNAKYPPTYRDGNTRNESGVVIRERLPYGFPSKQQRSYPEGIGPRDIVTVTTGQEFGEVADRLTRYWSFFERDASEDWIADRGPLIGQLMRAYRWYFWAADLVRDPIRILNGETLITAVHPNSPGGFIKARIELDTSAADDLDTTGRGDLITYIGDINVLHGISLAEVLPLLQKPTLPY